MDLTGNGDEDNHEAVVWDTKAVALFTRPRSKHWFAWSVIPQTVCVVMVTLDKTLVVEDASSLQAEPLKDVKIQL